MSEQDSSSPVGDPNLYDNPQVMYHLASLVGIPIKVKMCTGDIYEGIFTTVSEKGDVVLEAAYQNFSHEEVSMLSLEKSYPGRKDSLIPKILLKWKDVVIITAKTVDTRHVITGGFTDNEISKYPSNKITVRELLPWEGDYSDKNDVELENDIDAAKGWDVNEMFKINADSFGVQSTFRSSSPEYTIPLVKRNTELFRHREQLASKLAKEIESDNNRFLRLQVENCDENECFSSVQDNMSNSLKSSPISFPKNEEVTCGGMREYEKRNSRPGGIDLSEVCDITEYIQISPSLGSLALTNNSANKVFNAEEFNGNAKKSSMNGPKGELNIQNEVNALKNNEGYPNVVKNGIIVDELSDIVRKSTLNPYAEEFVFHPNAPCFTPQPIPSGSLYSPSSVHNAGVVTSDPHPQIASSGHAIFSYYPHQHATYNNISLPSYPTFQQSCGGGRKGQDMPTMQVAAATGQPLLVSNPISNGNSVHYPPGHIISVADVGHSLQARSHPVQPVTSHYGQSAGSHHGQSVTNHPGHTIVSHHGQLSSSHPVQTASPSLQVLTHPQIPYIVGPRVLSPQPMSIETSYSVPYCDHLNVQNFDARNRMR